MPEEPINVKRIFREYLEGKSIIQVARKLEKDGIKTFTGLDKMEEGNLGYACVYLEDDQSKHTALCFQ